MEKLEWCGCMMVKNYEAMFIHFDRMHERDGQTERQTHTVQRHSLHLCIALHGNNALTKNSEDIIFQRGLMLQTPLTTAINN